MALQKETSSEPISIETVNKTLYIVDSDADDLPGRIDVKPTYCSFSILRGLGSIFPFSDFNNFIQVPNGVT
jgi:hypothetical protein